MKTKQRKEGKKEGKRVFCCFISMDVERDKQRMINSYFHNQTEQCHYQTYEKKHLNGHSKCQFQTNWSAGAGSMTAEEVFVAVFAGI